MDYAVDIHIFFILIYFSKYCTVWSTEAPPATEARPKNHIFNSILGRLWRHYGPDGWLPSNFSNLEMFIQGVSLLSEESELLISPCQSWFIYNSLSSIWPIDVRNLQGPSINDNQFSILMPDPPISIFPSLINFCLYEDSLILEIIPLI